MEPGKNETLSLNMNCVYLSFNHRHHFPSSVVSLCFPLCFVHNLYVAWTGMTVWFVVVLFLLLSFFKTVTWPQKPTHDIPPRESHELMLVLLLPFSTPHWNEQLNPTDVSERPQSKPERRGRDIYKGAPSRLTTDEPPSFSARVCRSLRSSKPFTCHSCLIPSNFLLMASFELA